MHNLPIYQYILGSIIGCHIFPPPHWYSSLLHLNGPAARQINFKKQKNMVLLLYHARPWYRIIVKRSE